jgi:hypothetical protein
MLPRYRCSLLAENRLAIRSTDSLNSVSAMAVTREQFPTKNAPAAFPESWRGVAGALSQRVLPPT